MVDTTNMLHHQQVILEHVTEDNDLFLKELNKSISWLPKEDIKKLYGWLKENFWEEHRNEIEMAFRVVAT